jgi:hypothetical protein
MTASMHPAFVARSVRKIGRLLDRQRIHIRPETDRAGRGAGLQPADNTRPADPAKHFTPELSQLLCDKIGRPLLLEPELGMRMNIAPPVRHIVVESGNPLYVLHSHLLTDLPQTFNPSAAVTAN